MIGNFTACLAFTLTQEGGWADRSGDTPTNQGITLAAYEAFLVRKCTADDLRRMPTHTRDAIYHVAYWNKVSGDKLPLGIDLMVFDFGVTCGPGTSARMMQHLLGVKQDGDIGQITLAAIASHPASYLAANLSTAQYRYYAGLPNYSENPGWIARTERRVDTAMRMFQQPAAGA